MKTRMPFRYGIAVMTALPCLFVRLTVEIDGQPVYGFSSDGLARKWFTKDPESHYRDDIADMPRVVQQAFRHGQEMGGTDTIFALWRGIYDQQQRTPAMAAGITDYLWTMEQLLRFSCATLAANYIPKPSSLDAKLTDGNLSQNGGKCGW